MADDGPRMRHEGLLLRLPVERDVPAITAACQDPDIQRYTTVPGPYTSGHARRFVADARRDLDAGEGFPLAVTDLDDDRLLGMVGIVIDTGSVAGALGYWITAEARGRGVATTATGLLSRYALEELGLERLEIQAATENVASNAVASRLGFRLEGTRRRAAPVGHAGTRGGPRFDMNVWGLLPGELRWPVLGP